MQLEFLYIWCKCHQFGCSGIVTETLDLELKAVLCGQDPLEPKTLKSPSQLKCFSLFFFLHWVRQESQVEYICL